MQNESMQRLSTEKQVAVVSAMVEGCSINATALMTGASKLTILKLLLDIESTCLSHENAALRDLNCEKIQVDEV